MSGSDMFWGRSGWVEIEGVSIPSGLDFKIDIKKTGDVYTSFTCSILGLSLETIRKVTVFNDALAASQQRQIRVYAGYNDSIGPKLVARGWIRRAIPTSPPEMWLNIDANVMACDNRVISKAKELKAKTVKDLFFKMCNEIDRDGRWIANKTRIGDGYVKDKGPVTLWCDGMYGVLPDRFAKKFGVLVYDDNGTLVCGDRNGQYNKPESVEPMDIDHGLIGIVNVDCIGAVIRTRMNDSYKLQTWLDLKSELIPSANGKYFVYSKHHVGQLRGNDWYTELKLFRRM